MARVESKWIWTMMDKWSSSHPKPCLTIPKPPEWKVEAMQEYQDAVNDHGFDLKIWQSQYDAAYKMYQSVEINDRYFRVHDKIATQLIYAELEHSQCSVPETQELWNKLKGLRAIKSGDEACSEYYFITITPGAGVDMSDFARCAERFCKRKFVRAYSYAFEQSGEVDESMGRNPHVHIVLRQSKHYSRSKIKQYVDETFKCLFKPEGLSGTKIKPQFADVKCCKSTTVKTQVEKYILGDKKDESKLAAVELNGRWRTLHGLEGYYTAGDLSFIEDDDDEQEQEE